MPPHAWTKVARCAWLIPILLACSGEEFVRPNIVLISVDGLRASHLRCYGGERELGAEMCELGENGVRYVWAFTTASSGGPAAASLLTSQYPRQHGVRHGAQDFLRARSGTLAESLRAGGYATGAFVGSPELNRSRNFQQGFDVFDDRSASPLSDALETALTEAALSWAERAPRPYFLWIHFAEPHGPFTEERVEERIGQPADAPRKRRDEPELLRVRYEASIRRLDRRLSQLIAVLDASGAVPGILLVGLHGQDLDGSDDGAPAHGSSLRLEEIRVPLLWRPPRAAPGQNVARRVTTPVSLIDVAPTLLDAAGLRWPPSFQGLGLPGSRGAANDVTDRAIFAEHPREIAVIAGGEYARAKRPPRATTTPGDGGDESPPAPAWAEADLTANLRPDRERGDERLPAYDPPGSSTERASRLGRLISDFAAASQP